jgi:hypothetical protein
MSFKNIAIVSAIIAFVLGMGYLFFGSLVIGRWEIEPTNNILFLCRRMGSIYLGLSIILFLSRSLPLSMARTTLSIGLAVALSLLALLGIYEYSLDRVGSGILVSVVIESLLAIGYIMVLYNDRKSPSKESPINK